MSDFLEAVLIGTLLALSLFLTVKSENRRQARLARERQAPGEAPARETAVPESVEEAADVGVELDRGGD